MRHFRLLCSSLLICGAYAQVTSRPSFEVATIKPYTRTETGHALPTRITGGPGSSDPGRITYANVTLQKLLLTAYELAPYQLSASADLDSDSARFVIEATIRNGSTKKDVDVMLQNLLADRFKVTFHRENRVLPGYELTLVKKGPMLRDAPVPALEPGASFIWKKDQDGFTQPPPGESGTIDLPAAGGFLTVGMRQTAAELASALSLRLKNRPVIDKTGLTGTYNYNLEYASDRRVVSQPDVASDPKPDVVAAVREQLGLKLESKPASVEVLVIDHIEKIPTPN